ncbi:M48 family metalloprotease [Lipingzhangella sp. LS1_29]|uniref:Protease HtpX homolog n=1 Tax=Lipingzhangella rawalii TaxID=2055835 RepID=A0ABU2H8Y1_9ACTN|nr:M48 family metalloprotease [Lipingzhangella rawalii]MDS1271765.1 M48 family metalloprotease [Lipingzhangella rawalii]
MSHCRGGVVRLSVLLAVLAGAALLLGWVCAGAVGLLIGGLVAVALPVVGYVLSERMALRAVGARPISEIQYPELYRVVREVATEARAPVPRVYLSSLDTPNAFALGHSPRRAAVCVTAGLLRILDERELRGVLAHELSHVYQRDSLVLAITATLATMVTWLANLAWLLPLSDAEDEDVPAMLGALFFLVVGPLAALVVQLGVSRSREYRADAAAARITGDPLGLAQALRKIEVRTQTHPAPEERALLASGHLMIVAPFPRRGLRRLFASHPPVVERIRRLRRLADEVL